MMSTGQLVAFLTSLTLLSTTVYGKPVHPKHATADQRPSSLVHNQGPKRVDNSRSEDSLLLLLKKATENTEQSSLINKNFSALTDLEKLVEGDSETVGGRVRRSSGRRQGGQVDKKTELCREICR